MLEPIKLTGSSTVRPKVSEFVFAVESEMIRFWRHAHDRIKDVEVIANGVVQLLNEEAPHVEVLLDFDRLGWLLHIHGTTERDRERISELIGPIVNQYLSNDPYQNLEVRVNMVVPNPALVMV